MASIKKEARFLFAASDRNKQVASMVLELCSGGFNSIPRITHDQTYGELIHLMDDESFEIDILLRTLTIKLLHTLETAESSVTRIENSVFQFIEDQGEE